MISIRSEIDRLNHDLGEHRGNPLENPSTPLYSLDAAFSWANGNYEPTAAGELITPQSAMQQSTVAACVRVISESAACLPLKLYRRSGKAREEAIDDDLHYLLSARPNDETNAITFWECIFGSMALTGNAYAEIQRSGSKVLGLWQLHPFKTDVVRLSDGSLVYTTTDGAADATKPRIIKPENILAFPLFSFDGLKGMSPIAAVRQDLGLSKAALKFGSRFFGNGAKASTVIQAKSAKTKEQIEAARTAWELSQGGENQNRTAFLGSDWEIKELSISPEDSQFLQTRQFQRGEICGIFRVFEHMIGGSQKATGSSAEQMAIDFVRYTLKPYLIRVEQEVDAKLLHPARKGRPAGAPRMEVKFDFSEMLRGDLASTMEAVFKGRGVSVLSVDEAREYLGKDPVGGELGATFLQPTNMAQVDAQTGEAKAVSPGTTLQTPTPADPAPKSPALSPTHMKPITTEDNKND